MSFRPVVPREPGTVKAAIARLFDQLGGIKRVGVRLPHVKKSQLYSYTDPSDDSQIRFADVAALTQPGCDAAVEYLALLAGGVFLPLPAPGADAVTELTARMARESGETIAVLVEAMRDGRMTRAEARRALKEIDELMRIVAHLRGRIVERLNEEAP